ncbi:hypothetical protein TNIN_201571 [Trichonephila inaurata madagascariensis]|uniref:Uncharacterized protein n=1 Tax=Trichonephila inaurata madagascariensis TaxID=2747483 RepID=A0A8X6XE16_9ARAC|nr:hypothetical protein TNIN_201571 [Trichonephila inaurata madagascariensis]
MSTHSTSAFDTGIGSDCVSAHCFEADLWFVDGVNILKLAKSTKRSPLFKYSIGGSDSGRIGKSADTPTLFAGSFGTIPRLLKTLTDFGRFSQNPFVP